MVIINNPMVYHAQQPKSTMFVVLFGVEEPICGIHGPNESVDPTEITAIATAEAIFLANFAKKQ